MVERPLHLGSGGVAAGVHDASPRVSAFAAERPTAGRRLIELRSVADQFGDSPEAVSNDGRHRIGIAQPGTGRQGVGDVRVDRVVGVRQHHGNPALGVVGGRRTGLAAGLAEHDHPSAGAVRGQRRGQTADAGADDNDVGTLLPGRVNAHSPPPGWPIAIIRCTLWRARCAVWAST